MARFISAIKAAIVLLFVLTQMQLSVTAQDWPQWRGPGRDGIIPAFTEPKAWPDQLKKKWQISVGTGHSSPLLVKQKVYLFSRQGEQEVVSCIDFETGKQIWRDAYSAAYTMNSASTRHGKGPKSTPVFHAGKLCTLGISGILSCYDAENGAVLTSGDKLFFLTNDAELIVAKANSSGLEQLHRYSVAQSATWAHPVLVGERILIKDAETLTLWSLN